MKKLILSLVAIATITLSSFGQAPEGFKYQAVVRDAGNTILNNQAVGMQIEILQGGISGTPVYTESFAPTTNTYGLVNLEIGTGTTSDDFTIIDWANDTYFIRTSIDVTGGSSYAVMGTSQLMSVPYALHAKTAESSIIDNVDDADNDPTNELQDWTTLPSIPADFADDVDNVDDADNDPTNEYNTSAQINGTDLEVTDGGGTVAADISSLATDVEVLAAVAASDALDLDTDPANEIQTISRTGTTVTLSNGGGTFTDSVGVYTAGEGVDITNNVVTAAHPAMQSFESSFALINFAGGMTQTLGVGFVSFIETGYVAGPTSVTVINAGKYLINYDATFEMQSCGPGLFSDYRYRIAVNGAPILSSEITGFLVDSCFPRESLSRSIFLVLNAGDVVTTEVEILCCEDLRVINNNFSIVKL